jgi:hypothetical protein
VSSEKALCTRNIGNIVEVSGLLERLSVGSVSSVTSGPAYVDTERKGIAMPSGTV